MSGIVLNSSIARNAGSYAEPEKVEKPFRLTGLCQEKWLGRSTPHGENLEPGTCCYCTKALPNFDAQLVDLGQMTKQSRVVLVCPEPTHTRSGVLEKRAWRGHRSIATGMIEFDEHKTTTYETVPLCSFIFSLGCIKM